jgi:hypothetical protein
MAGLHFAASQHRTAAAQLRVQSACCGACSNKPMNVPSWHDGLLEGQPLVARSIGHIASL